MADLEKSANEDNKRCGVFLPVLFSFAAGIAAGAAIAILYAPSEGKDTRNKIRDRVSDYSERAVDLVDASREQLEEAKEKMAEAYDDAVEKTASAIEEARAKLVSENKQEEDK